MNELELKDMRADATVEVTVSRDMRGLLKLASEQRGFLVVISGARLGERVLLGEQAVTIGRGATCGMVLEADSVSRHHARIEPYENGYRVIDLKSTNGTFVNEARVSERVLSDGDRVQIGKVLLKYVARGNVEGAYHEEVQRLMRFDGLTAIHNKAHFDEAFRAAVAAASATPLSLIVFDIDHFKKINDTRGHTAGDAVLRQLAGVVKGLVPEGYVFARVGGEEFAIVGSGATLDVMLRLAETIRTNIARTHFSFDSQEIPTTISLGVAAFGVTPDDSAEQLYGRADERLYVAKRSGRNRVC